MHTQVVAGVVLVCALASCSPTTESNSDQPSGRASGSPTPTVIVLTEDQAAERYMTAVCPSIQALVRFNRVYEGGYVDDPMTDELRTEAKKLSAADRQAARQLVDSDYAWPESVARDVERVAERIYSDAAELSYFAKQDTAIQIDWGSSTKAATRIRLRLGLPPGGTGCKKWVG